MSYYEGYPPYVSVAEKRAKAEKKIKQLQKKNPDLRPVILQGRALAKTWWGKAWNKNLESYADYTNRIDRGRSYVRHLAVLDLQIAPGKVTALVQGSHSNPYQVLIKIAKIKQINWETIKKECQYRLSSLPDLLAGNFPKGLREIFMLQGQGLFPTPAEISFDCSCPDSASMCKHIAATLYGVGVRLDEDTALFFTLRQAAMDDLVSQAVQDKTASILAGDTAKGSNVIADDRLAELFGIDMDDFAAITPKKINVKKGKPDIQKTTNPIQTATQYSIQGHPTATALVLHCITASSQSGLSIKDLQQITGLTARKLYGILARLKLTGRVKNRSRGIYSRI
jgi:uncharacterized Zn finger protein